MTVSRSTVSQTVSRQALLFRPKSSVNIDCLVMAGLVVDILVLATISLTVISDMFRAVKKPPVEAASHDLGGFCRL